MQTYLHVPTHLLTPTSPSSASSRRTHLTLVVVVPPSPPQMRVGGELWPAGGLLGSLQEGGRLEVTCTVVGGVPRPAVVWRRDDEVSGGRADGEKGDIIRKGEMGKRKEGKIGEGKRSQGKGKRKKKGNRREKKLKTVE